MLSAMNALDMALHKIKHYYYYYKNRWQIIYRFYNNKTKINIFTTVSECVLISGETCSCNSQMSTCVNNLKV